MHWNDYATIGASLAAAVLAFWGSVYGVRRATKDAERGRFAEETVEHRRWRRDRAADIYVQTIAFCEYLRRGRDRLTRILTTAEPEPVNPLTESPEMLAARLQAYGTRQVIDLFDALTRAHDNLKFEFEQLENAREALKLGTEPRRSVKPERELVNAAAAAASEAHDRLIGRMVYEISVTASSSKYPFAPGEDPDRKALVAADDQWNE